MGFLDALGGGLKKMGQDALHNLEQGAPQYQVDDNGNTVPVNSGNGGTPPIVGNGGQPNAGPGQMFKNLLAGALNGLAMGNAGPTTNADGSLAPQGFGSSFAKGMLGVEAQRAGADELARKRAQLDFKNRLDAQEASDKHAESVATVDHTKAQTMHTNMLKMKVAQEVEASKFTNFEAQGKYGKTIVDEHVRGGGQVLYQDLTFDEAHQALGNDSTLLSRATFQQTGVKAIQNPDGTTTTVPTYTVYTPAEKIALTDADVKRFRDAGMVLPKALKGGVEVSGLQMDKWNNEWNQKNVAKLAQEKSQADINHVNAETNESKARSRMYDAQAFKARMEAKAANMEEQNMPRALVEGDMAPSDLSKRSKDYNAMLQAADDYSMKTYGKHFDIAKANRDYKYASNKQTLDTLNYLDSLTGNARSGTSGNLDELVMLSNKLKRTDFPALNDVAAWGRLKTGNALMARYHALAVDVADQFAKIMGGNGATTDAKIEQGLKMFNEGFNAEQIAGVADTAKTMLTNRKREMVKNNPYLKDYADPVTPQQGGGTQKGGQGGGFFSQFGGSTGQPTVQNPSLKPSH